MFTKLSQEQINSKKDFIRHFIGSKNAADGSTVDANANVTTKNIANLHGEIHKDINIQLNRAMNYDKIKEMFGEHLANEYIRQINNHEIYCHDESNICMPYCSAISLHPFITDGLKHLGGESKAPKHISSFCGGFVNLLLAVSGQFAGACMHGSQQLVLKRDGKVITSSSKELIENYILDGRFSNFQGDWEFSNVDDIDVWENGKFVKVKKVYRRKYKGKIYKITTISGKVTKVSEDHIFKVKYKGRDVEVKAKDLIKYDTVYNTAVVDFPIDKTSKDYKDGQFIGIIAGDGNITSEDTIRVAVNTSQSFISDFLDEYCENNFGKKGTPIEDKRTNAYVNYYIGSTNICKGVRKEFIDGYDSYTKNVDLKNRSLNWLLGFLDGILVTDGCYNNSLIITLANENLIKTIKLLLEKIYINVEIKNILVVGNRQPEYQLIIPSKVIKYLDLMNKKKLQNNKYMSSITHEVRYYGKYCFFNSSNASTKGYMTLTSYKEEQENISDTNNNFDCIDNIEIMDNDDEYVYEIETESHWYSCGGILTHNCATTEFFIYMDYFARKDYGENYLETHKTEITQHLQHVVYVINQPAVARNSQSVFWNVSILDKYFMKGLFEHFRYPDNSELNYESVDKLQFFFLNWFNKERERTVLTFPVVSVSMLSDTKTNTPKDYEFAVKIAEEMERKNSFFIYHSNSVDSLSSCCRLKSMINTNEFAYTLGNIGIMTGSIHVITLNMNRLIQKYHRKWMYEERVGKHSEMLDFISNNIREEIQTIHKYHVAFRQILKGYQSAGLLPVYDAGFITLDKQYSTIGINGLVEGCEYLGLKISNNPDYIRFVSSLLKVISDENKKAKEFYKCMFNTEFVPAENLGVKNAKWDKDDDFKVTRDCFNSYFYIVEDDTINVIDKFILHGDQITKYLDGGSALHLNLQEHLTKEQYLHLMNIAIKTGCSYWTINVLATCCEECEHIDKDTLLKCSKCGSSNITYATRIIGYLKKISSFSTPRQIETSKRYRHGAITNDIRR